jgi:GT2 family glycosyltransferase
VTPQAASVVIVSRGRPELLRRCLVGLDQQDHSEFEIVVVADAEGITSVERMGWSDRVKALRFDQANISVARNRGIAEAAAPVVAFVDDDAVPEYDWLRRLTAPITEGRADAAGGFVIGRNGISFQWTAREVYADTTSKEIEVDPYEETILTGCSGKSIKTEGTNMAFRRDLLIEMGGFDPGFRYFLDETDLNMRLAQRGARTAIVPLARVHHGFAVSDRRQADRAPRDLAPVGASLARFLARHGEGVDRDKVYRAEREKYRVALVVHMVAGRILPSAVGGILHSFDKGWATPATDEPAPAFAEVTSFKRFVPRAGATSEHRVIWGWLSQLAGLRRRARETVAEGKRVTVYAFSLTSLYHRRRFDPEGYWEQRGGLFGRSLRTDPIFRYWRRAERARREERLGERK